MLMMAGYVVAVFVGFALYIAIVNSVFVDAGKHDASAPTWELSAMLLGPLGWLGWLLARAVPAIRQALTSVFGAISLLAILAAIIYFISSGVASITPSL